MCKSNFPLAQDQGFVEEVDVETASVCWLHRPRFMSASAKSPSSLQTADGVRKTCKVFAYCYELGCSFVVSSCEVSVCEPNPCSNGGKCIKDGNNFDCVCTEGFSGRFCKVGNYSLFYSKPRGCISLSHTEGMWSISQAQMTATWMMGSPIVGMWVRQTMVMTACTGTPTSSWPTAWIPSNPLRTKMDLDLITSAGLKKYKYIKTAERICSNEL